MLIGNLTELRGKCLAIGHGIDTECRPGVVAVQPPVQSIDDLIAFPFDLFCIHGIRQGFLYLRIIERDAGDRRIILLNLCELRRNNRLIQPTLLNKIFSLLRLADSLVQGRSQNESADRQRQ